MTSQPTLRGLALACALFASATAAWAVDSACKLAYPIVLSHNWSILRICKTPVSPAGTPCEQLEDYERLCADKSVTSAGLRACRRWAVPDEDAALPPRDTNATDPTLQRNLRGYYRYFSKAIVDRLGSTCGNSVYVADKPPYASNDIRARSLRHTVQQALRETGAAKVIVIGLSQGVQDARFMATSLPLDDANPAGPRMGSKVAAIVSLSGEDSGAESASLQLDAIYLSTLGHWADQAKAYGNWDAAVADDALWKRRSAPEGPRVLVENCQGTEQCTIRSVDQKYRWYLRSVADVSTMYMKPDAGQRVAALGAPWTSLRQLTGMKERHWEEAVPPALEAQNGARYFSYGAGLWKWQDGFEFQEVYYAIWLMSGMNDGFVSVGHQWFDRPGLNATHIKTLKGSIGGSGYHHMFFSGRNDALYSPKPGAREAAPYGGSAADFFQQVARDLRARGL